MSKEKAIVGIFFIESALIALQFLIFVQNMPHSIGAKFMLSKIIDYPLPPYFSFLANIFRFLSIALALPSRSSLNFLIFPFYNPVIILLLFHLLLICITSPSYLRSNQWKELTNCLPFCIICG